MKKIVGNNIKPNSNEERTPDLWFIIKIDFAAFFIMRTIIEISSTIATTERRIPHGWPNVVLAPYQPFQWCMPTVKDEMSHTNDEQCFP